jgi:hypothetical protein
MTDEEQNGAAGKDFLRRRLASDIGGWCRAEGR